MAERGAELVLVGTNHTRAPLAGARAAGGARPRPRAARPPDRRRPPWPRRSASRPATAASSTWSAADADAHARGGRASGLGRAVRARRRAARADAVRRTSGERGRRHLFGVAGGLDSMVPGEAQILAQIREAYESAYEWDATGPVTNRLFHQALEAGKRVRHETAIGEGGASPASVAAELAAERLGDGLATPRCWSSAPGGWPSSSRPTWPPAASARSRVANRDADRAAALASRFGGRAVDFAELRGGDRRGRRRGRARRPRRSRSSHAGDVPPGPARADRPRGARATSTPPWPTVDGASLHTIDDLEAVGRADHRAAPGRGRPRPARSSPPRRRASATGWRRSRWCRRSPRCVRTPSASGSSELERAPAGRPLRRRPRAPRRPDPRDREQAPPPADRPPEAARGRGRSAPYAEAVTELFGLAAVE